MVKMSLFKKPCWLLPGIAFVVVGFSLRTHLMFFVLCIQICIQILKLNRLFDSWSIILVSLSKITTETWKPHNWFCYLLPACHFGNSNIVKNYNMPDHEIFNHILTIQRSMSKVCTTKGSVYCYPVSIAFLMSQFWFYSLFLAWLVTTKKLFPKLAF